MAGNQEFTKILNEIKIKTGFTQGEIAKSLKLTQQYISDVKNGRVPFSEALRKNIYENFHIKEEPTQAATANLTSRARTRTIPYYKDLPVTAGGDFQFDDLPATPEYIQLQDINGAEAAFPVIGCSMEPTIHEGEVIGVRRIYNGDPIDPDRIYLIVTSDQQRMIKHIARYDRESETLTLTSDNKEFAPFDIPASFVTAVFRVCFHIQTC